MQTFRLHSGPRQDSPEQHPMEVDSCTHAQMQVCSRSGQQLRLQDMHLELHVRMTTATPPLLWCSGLSCLGPKIMYLRP